MESDRLVYDVIGLHCANCAANVQKALELVTGTGRVQVDLEAGKAFVDADAGEPPFDALAKAVARAGYELKRPEESPGA
jgi:Cu+-exporting ATPase